MLEHREACYKLITKSTTPSISPFPETRELSTGQGLEKCPWVPHVQPQHFEVVANRLRADLLLKPRVWIFWFSSICG